MLAHCVFHLFWKIELNLVNANKWTNNQPILEVCDKMSNSVSECMIRSFVRLLWTANYHKTLGTLKGYGLRCRDGSVFRDAQLTKGKALGLWNRVSEKWRYVCPFQGLNRHMSNIARAADTVQCQGRFYEIKVLFFWILSKGRGGGVALPEFFVTFS